MQEETRTILYEIFLLILGGILGSCIASAITILSVTQDLGTTDKDIEKIRQAEKDCIVKEYYYMDKHREFCDRIGVSP